MELSCIESDKCCVCLESMLEMSKRRPEDEKVDKRPVILCLEGHSSCDSCRMELVQKKMGCPICRKPLVKERVVNIGLMQLVSEVESLRLSLVKEKAKVQAVVEGNGSQDEMVRNGSELSQKKRPPSMLERGVRYRYHEDVIYPYGFGTGYRSQLPLDPKRSWLVHPEDFVQLYGSSGSILNENPASKLGFNFLRCVTSTEEVNREPSLRAQPFLTDEGLLVWFPRRLSKSGLKVAFRIQTMLGPKAGCYLFNEAQMQQMGRAYLGCFRIENPRTIVYLFVALGMEKHDIETLVELAVASTRLKTSSVLYKELKNYLEWLDWGTKRMSLFREALFTQMVKQEPLPPFPLSREARERYFLHGK